jgi:hypothetical protein
MLGLETQKQRHLKPTFCGFMILKLATQTLNLIFFFEFSCLPKVGFKNIMVEDT